MNNRDTKEMNKLLKVQIALLLRGGKDKPTSLREQIGILSDIGLAPTEIADILGRSGNYVNKELSELRKARKVGKKGDNK